MSPPCREKFWRGIRKVIHTGKDSRMGSRMGLRQCQEPRTESAMQAGTKCPGVETWSPAGLTGAVGKRLALLPALRALLQKNILHF